MHKGQSLHINHLKVLNDSKHLCVFDKPLATGTFGACYSAQEDLFDLDCMAPVTGSPAGTHKGNPQHAVNITVRRTAFFTFWSSGKTIW